MAIGVRGSALSPRSIPVAKEAIDAATHAAEIIGSMTPRSARQKGLDYAARMDQERSLGAVRQSSRINSPRPVELSVRPSPRTSAPQQSLISGGASEAIGIGSASMSKSMTSSPRGFSPRPFSAIPSSPSNSTPKFVPQIPLLQLSKVSLSERSPRPTSPKA